MNPAQAEVVRLVMEDGVNVFFHGAAGTGKSFVLRTLVALLKAARGVNAVAVTAPTVRPRPFARGEDTSMVSAGLDIGGVPHYMPV